MRIDVARSDCTEFATPLLAVKLFAGDAELTGPVAKLDDSMGGRISDVLRRGDFAGRKDETLLLYSDGAVPAERVLLVGLGKRQELDLERIRRAAATATRKAARLGLAGFASMLHHAELVSDRITAGDAAQAAAEGAVLAAFVFDEMKQQPDEPDADEPRTRVTEMTILEKVEQKAAEIEQRARVGRIVADGENLARRLGNLPGNVATPTFLADTARQIAEAHGMEFSALGPAEMEEEGLQLLLGVSRGSEQEPRLIVLRHHGGGEGEKPLVLLGKGLTFDSGGISIKPSQNMEDMKFDMCGGAAVLGAMQAIGELDLPVNVVAVVPSSENMINGRATKPGDIHRSHLGKTVEIINTDAEGRLILADSLSYLRRFDPAAVVDAATLTGACVIALGHHALAVLGNDEDLIGEVRAAGDRTGERAWPLPMFDEYRKQLDSDYADIKNSGGRAAGTVTAAWFLRDFVGDFPWAHLDIAGTAWGDGKLPYQSKGATGVPTRLFVDWVRARAG